MTKARLSDVVGGVESESTKNEKIERRACIGGLVTSIVVPLAAGFSFGLTNFNVNFKKTWFAYLVGFELSYAGFTIWRANQYQERFLDDDDIVGDIEWGILQTACVFGGYYVAKGIRTVF